MTSLVAMSRSRKLTKKQRLFVVHYLGIWNATEAAKRAGYAGSRAVLSSVGAESLRNPQIARAISEELDRLVMGPEEVLSRLSIMARGSLDPFLATDEDTGEVFVDLTTEPAKEHMALVKRVEQTVLATNDDGSRVIKTKLEIHDPKVALDSIAKAHGMFRQRVELSGPAGAPIAVVAASLDDKDADELVAMYRELSRTKREGDE